MLYKFLGVLESVLRFNIVVKAVTFSSISDNLLRACTETLYMIVVFYRW